MTAILVLFCGTMTFLLIRSEYYPEGSALQQVPPAHLLTRFLRNEALSSLSVLWKGEPIGAVSLRVYAPNMGGTLMSGTVRVILPILGREPKFHMDMQCRVKSRKEFDRLHLNGKFETTSFDVDADAARDLLRIESSGPHGQERHELKLSELTTNGGKNIVGKFPQLKDMGSLPSAQSVESTLAAVRLTAASTKLKRRGEMMDAYVFQIRQDANLWFKLWMAPTGDLLKFDSSFGLTALNEDYFEGNEELPVRRKETGDRSQKK